MRTPSTKYINIYISNTFPLILYISLPALRCNFTFGYFSDECRTGCDNFYCLDASYLVQLVYS